MFFHGGTTVLAKLIKMHFYVTFIYVSKILLSREILISTFPWEG